jgi:hypothetical protein
MYHPFEPGVFWQESHWPEVRIYRKEMVCKIRLHVLPTLTQRFQEHLPDQQHYDLHYNRDWAIYTFSLYTGYDERNRERIRALNTLLELVSIFGSHEGYETTHDPAKAQIAFVAGNNPELTESRFGACEVWASFSPFGTTYCQEADHHALEEYVSSRMKGVYRILFPGLLRRREDIRMRLQQSNLPIFWTDNVDTLLGITGNQVDSAGGFSLAPQNVDSHFQQCILLVGVLVLWQRIRQARFR